MTFSGLAHLTSTTNRQVWARPPIDVDFQVLMFTASGLIVRFLKVFEKSNYHSIKWVRYLTKASGSYQIRVSTSRCVPRRQSHRHITVLNGQLTYTHSYRRYYTIFTCISDVIVFFMEIYRGSHSFASGIGDRPMTRPG